MFRRKEEDTESTEANEVKSSDTSSTSSTTSSNSAVSAPAASTAVAPRPAEPKMAPVAQPASAYRPAPAPAARPAGFASAPASSSSHDDKGKKRILTVGNDILLKGEIATCDRLVIEGAVDAKLNDVHTVEIAETGSFKGSAEIEDAEISGLFEGDLIVRNRLIIYSTGKVRGKITYGEIEIERGGELTGEIKSGSSPASASSSSEDKSDKNKSRAA